MTSVYVTNVIRKVEVTPGATAGSGGAGTNILPLNNTFTGSNAFNKDVIFTSDLAATIPIVIKGYSGQANSLTEWRNSSNTVLAAVDNIGQISTNSNIYIGRGTSSGGGNKVLVLSNATAPSGLISGGGVLYSDSGALKYRDSSGAVYVPIPLTGNKGEILGHTGTGWIKVGAGANGQVLTSSTADASGLAWATGGSGGGHTIASAGTPFTQRTTLNFIGATVADDSGNNRTNVTITSGANYQIIKANGAAVTARGSTNYGTMFAIADDSGNNETDISIVSDQAIGVASLRTLGSGSLQAAPGTHTHAYDPAGTATTAVNTHATALDPHSDYITTAEGNALYAPVSNTANLGGGTTNQILAKVSNTSYAFQWVTGTGATLNIPYTAVSSAIGAIPFMIQGLSGQTSDLFQVKDNTGAQKFSVGPLGQLSIGAGAGSVAGTVRVIPVTAATKGLVVKRVTGQTAALLEVQDEAGASIMSISNVGKIAAPNIGPKLVVLNNAESVPGGTDTGSIILRRPA